jgi:hypothetical protein
MTTMQAEASRNLRKGDDVIGKSFSDWLRKIGLFDRQNNDASAGLRAAQAILLLPPRNCQRTSRIIHLCAGSFFAMKCGTVI